MMFNLLTNLNLIALSVITLLGCDNYQRISIPHQAEAISYSGRMDKNTLDSVDLYWPGSSIRVDYEGDSIFAILQDEKGENYFNIIIDSDSVRILNMNSDKRRYLVAAGLTTGIHSVELFKRTEWDRGRTSFFGFELTGENPKISKSRTKKRKMEFFGNSITAGYAVDDLSGGDSPDSSYTNHYASYASITARHFDADYYTTCKSGIGIMVSWFPMIMPELYNRMIPKDTSSQWDFSAFIPEVVVVNLFQNDSWLVERPEYSEFQSRFGVAKPSEYEIIQAYRNFIKSIRFEYPKAHIVCLLGNMNITQETSPWPAYVEKAASALDDDRVYTHAVPYKETSGHPNRKEQKELAESLISFIDTNIKW